MDEHNVPPGRIGDRSEDPPQEDSTSDHHEWSPEWEEHVPEAPSGFSALYLPIVLFIVTVFTTMWAGAYGPIYATYLNTPIGPLDFLMNDPSVIFYGLPYSVTLLCILVTHEFGHYFLSRIHKVPASLPMFIPGPPHLIGTFGAIIKMRSPISNKRALFDIGVAGPLAGFLVSVVALIIGLSRSSIGENDHLYNLNFGEPLLLKILVWIIHGPIPDRLELFLDPIAFGAWMGLFITALNLIPIGQLDGGHVVYALFGSYHRKFAVSVIIIMLFLGFFGWQGWFLWAALAGIIGLSHPPIIDPQTNLGRGRMWVAWITLGVFILCFSPVPFYFG
jgi:membrane-associated protease RseP (regulator of RpoE activity)